MKQENISSNRFVPLVQRFEAACTQLRSDHCNAQRDQKLVHWVLPKDLCVPNALLGKSLAELIKTPFDNFIRIRGFGGRKIETLVQLLERAVQHDRPPRGLGVLPPAVKNGGAPGRPLPFDPDQVSEAVWKQWKATIREYEFEGEPLGRFAQSLQELPKVAWAQSLGFYLSRSLAEIRDLRAHGEKRVHAILGVFHTLHDCLKRFPHDCHLNIRLEPRLIGAVEHWCQAAILNPLAIDHHEILRGLATPLMKQLEIDASPDVLSLVLGRLGIEQSPRTVRGQARELGVTRARVYQMLDEASRIMQVRWRAGDKLLRILPTHLQQNEANQEAVSFALRMRDLFYPEKTLAPAPRQNIQEVSPCVL